MTSSKESADPIKFVPKGWGYEKWMLMDLNTVGKILFMQRIGDVHAHFHELKDEVFFVYRGAIEVYHSNEDLLRVDMTLLGPGEKFHVPRGMRHQMVKP